MNCHFTPGERTDIVIAGGLLSLLAAVFVFAGVREKLRAPAAASQPKANPSPRLGPFLALAFVMHFGFAALQPTNAFYVQDLLGVATTRAMRLAGLVSAAFAACSFVVQAFVVAPLGLSPCRLLRAGLALCLIGLVACVSLAGPLALAALAILGALLFVVFAPRES